MDPFSTRKKTKKPVDPILQKRVKKLTKEHKEVEQLPQKSEKLEKLEKMLDEDKDDQLFDKFLSTYSQSASKGNKRREFAPLTNEAMRVKTHTIENSSYPLLESFGPESSDSVDFYQSHFDVKNLKQFINTYTEQTDKKIKEKVESKKVMSIIADAVDYSFENDEEGKLKGSEEDVLNNNVKIKQYKLKPALKDCNIVYRDKQNSLLLMNQCYEQSFKQHHMPPYSQVNTELEPLRKQYEDEILENEEVIYSRLRAYRDYVFCDPNEDNCVPFRKLYLNQLATHFKTIQALITKNEEIDKQVAESGDDKLEEQKIRVEGYTKTKALIITPNKGDCYEIVCAMKEVFTQKPLSKKGKRTARFIEDYGNEEKELDDDFKLGISIEKDSLKLYASFEEADIIIGSPLGLRLVIGNEGEQDRKFSFLSSIDILVLDRCHVFYMQNWEHIVEIMSVMNKIPRHKDVVNDITQIREYCFENLSSCFRQTIIYTEYRFPELNSLIRNHTQNHSGILMNKPIYKRLVNSSELLINQEFARFEALSHKDEPLARFNLFFKKLWDKIRENEAFQKTVIFTSSYFEFVRLRNHFRKINANVICISEYSSKPKVQSRVAKFNKGEYRFMLITERAQFFSVCKARKFLHIFFYSLPQNALVYKELLTSSEPIQTMRKGEASNESKLQLAKMMVKSLFCRFDAMALERIVGTEKTQEFLEEYNKNSTFVL